MITEIHLTASQPTQPTHLPISDCHASTVPNRSLRRLRRLTYSLAERDGCASVKRIIVSRQAGLGFPSFWRPLLRSLTRVETRPEKISRPRRNFVSLIASRCRGSCTRQPGIRDCWRLGVPTGLGATLGSPAPSIWFGNRLHLTGGLSNPRDEAPIADKRERSAAPSVARPTLPLLIRLKMDLRHLGRYGDRGPQTSTAAAGVGRRPFPNPPTLLI